MPGSEYSGIVRVRNELLGKSPTIIEIGPLGEQSWVFSTGSSNKWRDVHWQHLVDIRYNINRLMTGGTVSFKYLNTRACGGRVDVIFAQYADDGSLVWYQTKRLENWPGHYVSIIPGTINDRTWRSYTLTAEQAEELTQGRPFNCVIIREFDITSESGSGYFDDIDILLTEPLDEESPVEEETPPEEAACEPEIVEVEKIVEKEVLAEVPVEVIKEVIIEVPVEKIVEKIVYVDNIVEVPGNCSDGDCDIQNLEYTELLAKYGELREQIKELKACRSDVKKAMEAAKPKKVKKHKEYKDDNGHGNDQGRYDPSNPGKKYKN